MKPGSLVVILPYDPILKLEMIKYGITLPCDDEKTIYTVEAIKKPRGIVCVELAEHKIIDKQGREYLLAIEQVREVQRPDDLNISELLEECKEENLYVLV